MSHWETVIREEWERRSLDVGPGRPFPLAAQGFDSREIIAAVDVLLSGRITMGERVREFEKRFAEIVKAPYAVMVNSGSSANLLAVAAAVNHQKERHLPKGSEVLVPAVCWSTSVWPLTQLGLKPVFVDVDVDTLNLDLAEARKKITPKTKAIMAVHVLGNSAPMEALLALCKENGLMLLEDTCESLGSVASVGGSPHFLGTLGEFGTYSFYYSHHMTTGEGGMVVCKTLEDYDLLKCLRAHGWSRELSNRQAIEAANPRIDPHFLFVNEGFNFRPMEIQAAFGLCQLERLPSMNKARVSNKERLIHSIVNHPKWKGQLSFPVAAEGTEPVWFGLPCLLTAEHNAKRVEYMKYLLENGVENRPIISGNFTRQPALQTLGIGCHPSDFPNAEKLNDFGFFIGLHGEALPDQAIHELASILVGFDF
jgi:CDP-4-dehydro-6-deoxyglucose reductase, E1